MIDFTKKELDDGLRKEFQISEDYCQIIQETDCVNWDTFKSKTVKLGVLSRRFPIAEKASISLTNGIVRGDLIVTRMSESVEEMQEIIVSECQVSGKVKISGVKAKNIEVIGDFNKVELVNLSAGEIHICGEIEELTIKGVKDRAVNVEINGFADIVRVEDSFFNSLQFLTFSSNTVEIKNVEGERLILPKVKRRNIKKVGTINL